VDYSPAAQHRAEAAQALYPTDAQAARHWRQPAKDDRLTDEVWTIIF
jgi:hypothetical protein